MEESQAGQRLPCGTREPAGWSRERGVSGWGAGDVTAEAVRGGKLFLLWFHLDCVPTSAHNVITASQHMVGTAVLTQLGPRRFSPVLIAFGLLWFSPETCYDSVPWVCFQWHQDCLCSWMCHLCHQGGYPVTRSKCEGFCQELKQGPPLYPIPLWQPALFLSISLLKAYCSTKQPGWWLKRNTGSLLHEDFAAQIETLPKKSIPLSVTHTHTQLLKSWVLLINTVLRAQTLSVAVVSTGQGCVVCLLWLLNILPKRARWAWIIRSTWHFHRSPSMAVYGSFIFSLRDTS